MGSAFWSYLTTVWGVATMWSYLMAVWGFATGEVVEKVNKAYSHSPAFYGVDPLEYLRTTKFTDIWDDIYGWASSPWYHPAASAMQILEIVWWFVRELLLKSPLFWIILILSLACWTYKDYYRYLAVGRGGTPSTFYGWWRSKVLLFIANWVLRVNVFGAPFLDPMFEPYRGLLFNLPRREGDRPTILGLAPQRQGTQRVGPDTETAMVAILERKAAENPETLVMEQSYVEGHLRALKRRLPAGAVPGTPNTTAEWGGEMSHAHKLDGSAHVVLHPADVGEVVAAGWGERHPLAGCAEHWIWRFYHHTVRGIRLPLPYNIVLVYAPRNAVEMAMFERIIDASIAFHTLPENGANPNANEAPADPAPGLNAPGPAAPAPGPAAPAPAPATAAIDAAPAASGPSMAEDAP